MFGLFCGCGFDSSTALHLGTRIEFYYTMLMHDNIDKALPCGVCVSSIIMVLSLSLSLSPLPTPLQPIIGRLNSQSHIPPSFSISLPSESPPPSSLSLLHSRPFEQATHQTQGTRSNLTPGARVRDGFNPATFSIRRFYPREE